MHLPQVVSRSRATPWVFLILAFVVSLPAVTVRFYASDEIEYFAYLRSMWFDGDLSFDNEYHYFYDRGIARAWRFRETFLESETATGRRINFAPVGSAILWAPFYVATDAGVRVARMLGADVAADGYSTPYIASVVYASALYAFLALLLSAHAASRLVGNLQAGIGAAFAVWIGTPILFYMYLAPGFSHACSAFAVAAFVVLWLRVRQDWSLPGIAALGALAAVMGMVREQDLFVAIGPALDYLVTAARSARIRTTIARGAAGVATCAFCYLPQIVSYQVLFGRPAPSPTVERKMTWTSPHAWQVLASPENGLLFWTPLAIVALAGLVWLAARSWVALRLRRDGADPGVRVGQSGYMGGRGLVRTAAAGRADGVLGDRSGGVLRRDPARLATPRVAGVRGAGRLVEPRPDGAVRSRTHGSPAPRPASQRLQQLRRHPAARPEPCVSVRARPRVVLPGTNVPHALISARLLNLVRCPDCRARLEGGPSAPRCLGCGRAFESSSPDYLVLKPRDVFDETTKFLEDSFHADGRDETVSPPLLSAAVRNSMLQKFLDMKPADVVLDLGCGSGRFCVWSLESGAHVIGTDTGTFFAREARSSVDLVVGELRKLPFADASVTKAYTIDVLEHLSLEGLQATLREVSRILAPGGSLFVYTHVRQRSPLAPVLNLIARAASAVERMGLSDLTIEKLRKTDHLNPLMSRQHLDEVAAGAGFRVARFCYYTPVFSSVAENILVPVAAHAMARRAAPAGVNREAMRAARVQAKQRVGQRGLVYRVLRWMTSITMLDVTLFGRMRSGPFFALLVKAP